MCSVCHSWSLVVGIAGPSLPVDNVSAVITVYRITGKIDLSAL